MTNWVKVKVLGQGSYATVFLAKPTTEPLDYFAIKATRLKYKSSLSKEEQILQHFIECPEIVQCLGSETTIEETDSLYMAYYNLKLEYAAGGTLADLIKQQKKLPESDVKEYLRMILRGLFCIHREGFVHVDLKPANILAFPQSNGKMKLKIADFGLSMRCGEKDEMAEHCRLPMFKGTPKYMSPESITFSEFNCALDIWSLGCILVEMVSGESVWDDCSESDPEQLISKLVHNLEIPKIPEELSEEGKDFIRKCFDRHPRLRWTANMLLQHPYLREEKETTEKDDGIARVPDLQSKIQSSNRITKLPGLPKFPKELYLPHLESRLRSCTQN